LIADATWDPVTALRLRMLDDHTAAIAEFDAREREASRELGELTRRAGSTLGELCGIADRSDAELLVEAGDPAGSPARVGSPASTAPPHCPPHRLKATTNRNDTGSTEAATVASTPSCTGWQSPSCAANPGPDRSMTTPAATGTPRKKRCESSNATSPTPSTGG
jgi:hypothetical protein